MPKEKINQLKAKPIIGSVGCSNSSTDLNLTPAVGVVVDTESAVVQVGWNNAGWVQVSMEADKSYLQFAIDTPDGETSDRSTIYSPVLSRGEINKLIRTLRRARDAAYGRDE